MKIICNYCNSGNDKINLCYKGGMGKCKGDLFEYRYLEEKVEKETFVQRQIASQWKMDYNGVFNQLKSARKGIMARDFIIVILVFVFAYMYWI